MKTVLYHSLATVVLGLTFVISVPSRALTAQTPTETSTRTITDMTGRTVRIPSNISKALSVSPPPTTFIYMLAPEKLGGWLGPQSREGLAYIPKAYRDKPVFNWGKGEINIEAYIAAAPDIVFIGSESGADPVNLAVLQEKFGSIPLVCVDNTRDATGYAPTLRLMGDVLGVPERAEKLITYYEGVLREVSDKVSAIPIEKRVRVYYAEGSNGLATDPSGSVHSQLIDVCGGVNVAKCVVGSGSGMTPVALESVLAWQPQIIITTDTSFARQATGDESWKKIPAIAHHRIYVTPTVPFNWFDRPPGVNRIVGIPWTAHLLYPELFTEDWCKARITEFFDIFYHYTLSDEELQDILNQSKDIQLPFNDGTNHP